MRRGIVDDATPWVVVLALGEASLYLTRTRSFMILRRGNPILYMDSKSHAERVILEFQDAKPGFNRRLFATRAIWAVGEYALQEWQTEGWYRRRWRSRRSSW